MILQDNDTVTHGDRLKNALCEYFSNTVIILITKSLILFSLSSRKERTSL